MLLRQIAHARTGDKGDISNISVIVHSMADFERVRREVTAQRVQECLRAVVRGNVERFELPQLGALNFVLYRALEGGVTRSLALDAHGKCLGSVLLSMELQD